jgi:hypothetical protein
MATFLDKSSNARPVFLVDATGNILSSIGGGSGSITPATVVCGQVKITTTGTAVQLPANPLVNGVVVKLDPSASGACTIGTAGVTATMDGTGNGYILAPGEAASFAVSDTSAVWVNGSAGSIFSFEGN